MERIVTINPRRAPASDLRYWRSRPVAERIAAVEFLRAQAGAADESNADHAEPRLQRVCRVSRRAPR